VVWPGAVIQTTPIFAAHIASPQAMISSAVLASWCSGAPTPTQMAL
jgi:hypothetical protein